MQFPRFDRFYVLRLLLVYTRSGWICYPTLLVYVPVVGLIYGCGLVTVHHTFTVGCVPVVCLGPRFAPHHTVGWLPRFIYTVRYRLRFGFYAHVAFTFVAPLRLRLLRLRLFYGYVYVGCLRLLVDFTVVGYVTVVTFTRTFGWFTLHGYHVGFTLGYVTFAFVPHVTVRTFWLHVGLVVAFYVTFTRLLRCSVTFDLPVGFTVVGLRLRCYVVGCVYVYGYGYGYTFTPVYVYTHVVYGSGWLRLFTFYAVVAGLVLYVTFGYVCCSFTHTFVRFPRYV